MWHQISDNLIELAKHKAFDQIENEDLLDLYRPMIQPLHDKVNPIKYAIVTVHVSRQFTDIEKAIEFLGEAKDRLKSVDAKFLCRIAQAEKRLRLGQHHDCIEQLNAIRAETEPMADIDPRVYASLANVSALYYRRREDYENYYKSGLQFLHYTPDSELSPSEKLEFSI